MERIRDKLQDVWSNITIEPLAFVTMVIVFLSDISTQELYLQKACQVNLNHTASLCANMTQPKTAWLQQETQQYVAEVQAHNGFLQRLPSVVFTLFAGPLSDSYGRKPLLVVPLVGFLILNMVYLANVIWFQELKVEYLLFECLQDLTGGKAIFMLAARCYIMDVSSVEHRTARLCFLSATTGLAVMIASPLGTIIRANWGFTFLYSFTLTLVIFTLIYSYFIKDSIHLVTEERRNALGKEKEAAEIKCDRGVCNRVMQLILRALKALMRARPARKYIWCFMAINILATIGGELAGVLYMFYQLQYKISNETFGWMMSAWAGGTFLSQLLLVPFLSVKLGLRDTTIIIMALASNILDVFLETVMTQVWFLFLSWGVIQMLWGCMFDTALSAISKLVEPTEIGKFLSLVSLANTIASLGAAPAYNLIYQATLSTYPAIAIYVGMGVFIGDLALAIFTHVSLKGKEDVSKKEEMQENAPTMSTHL